jgi:hypothetical protein
LRHIEDIGPHPTFGSHSFNHNSSHIAMAVATAVAVAVTVINLCHTAHSHNFEQPLEELELMVLIHHPHRNYLIAVIILPN